MLSHLFTQTTCALSPEGNAGFETSFRRGMTRSLTASSDGRFLANMYFIGSVTSKVKILHIKNQ